MSVRKIFSKGGTIKICFLFFCSSLILFCFLLNMPPPADAHGVIIIEINIMVESRRGDFSFDESRNIDILFEMCTIDSRIFFQIITPR